MTHAKNISSSARAIKAKVLMANKRRTDLEYRFLEREKNRERMKILRKNEFYKERERERNKMRMRIRRMNEHYGVKNEKNDTNLDDYHHHHQDYHECCSKNERQSEQQNVKECKDVNKEKS